MGREERHSNPQLKKNMPVYTFNEALIRSHSSTPGETCCLLDSSSDNSLMKRFKSSMTLSALSRAVADLSVLASMIKPSRVAASSLVRLKPDAICLMALHTWHRL